MFLSIIIPAYNEEDVILQAIQKTAEYFNSQKRDFEIIVVNDGSIDKTADVVRRAAGNHPNLKIIDNKKNQGKGASVRNGAFSAHGDWILFLDADLSTDPEEFEKFKPYLNDYEIIIGSRAVPGAKIVKRQPLLRELIGKCANILIRLVLGLPYHDTQCGFKIFNRRTLAIFKEQKLTGWLFDAELLYLAKKKNFRVKEIGIRWKNDPTTTVRKSDFLKLLNDLYHIRKLHH